MKEQEKKSVVDQVLDGIVSRIIDGTLKPGDQLPTEMELCEQYNAGRNSVREAIKKLEANGVVYIKRADGTFVSKEYNQKFLDPMLYSIILKKNNWHDFVELRSVIDIGTLLVIMDKELSQEKLDHLKEILHEMEVEVHKEQPCTDTIMELDTMFHTVLTGMTNNPQLVTITEYVTRLTIPSRWQTVEKVRSMEDFDNFVKLHWQMLDVIENKQRDKVVQTVKNHFVYWADDSE